MKHWHHHASQLDLVFVWTGFEHDVYTPEWPDLEPAFAVPVVLYGMVCMCVCVGVVGSGKVVNVCWVN
jgi:hypothetical protein